VGYWPCRQVPARARNPPTRGAREATSFRRTDLSPGPVLASERRPRDPAQSVDLGKAQRGRKVSRAAAVTAPIPVFLPRLRPSACELLKGSRCVLRNTQFVWARASRAVAPRPPRGTRCARPSACPSLCRESCSSRSVREPLRLRCARPHVERRVPTRALPPRSRFAANAADRRVDTDTGQFSLDRQWTSAHDRVRW